MKINRIIALGLESKVKKLRAQGKTQEEISKIISEETGQPITKHTVSRYFLADTTAKAEVIEKSDKLKMKVVDAEINTIRKRVEIIDKFLDISEQALSCGDFKAAIMALKGATQAQDSLDVRLGKLKAPSNTNNINILNIQEQTANARERFTDAVLCIANRSTEREYSQ